MATRPDRKPAPPSKPARATPKKGAAAPKGAPARAGAATAKTAPSAGAKAKAGRPAVRAGRPTVVSPRAVTREGPGPVVVMPPVERAREVASAAATRWALVTARDLMRHNVVTVAKNSPLSELERILADHRITGAPVVDEAGTIVGVVSMRDLIDRYSEDVDAKPRREPNWFAVPFEHVLEEEEYAPFDVPKESEETVADIMTADVVSVPADAGIREISRTMTQKKVHRVLVEREGQPGTYVGIVGTFEILDMLAE